MALDSSKSNENGEDIKNILKNCKNIAVVGLSPKEEKDSYRVAKYMQNMGYMIFPIYPKEDEILGQKVYRSIEEIEEKIDIVNIFRKSSAVEQIVDSVLKRGGVEVVWMQIGIRDENSEKKAKEAGISVIQDRCIMVEHKRLNG